MTDSLAGPQSRVNDLRHANAKILKAAELSAGVIVLVGVDNCEFGLRKKAR
jgi:hypothetical protein